MDFAELHEGIPGEVRHRPGHAVFAGAHNAAPGNHGQTHGDGAFDDAEPDVVDDDEGLEDGSEMAIDTQPLLGSAAAPGLAASGPNLAAPPIPPPPPQPPFLPGPPYQHGLMPHVGLPGGPIGFTGLIPPRVLGSDDEDGSDSMDATSPVRSTVGASTAVLGPHGYLASQQSRSRQASGAGPVAAESGPSTATIHGQPPRYVTSSTPLGNDDDSSGSPSRSNGDNLGDV